MIKSKLSKKLEKFLWNQKLKKSKKLIQEAKQDVENLIEGNFDMSKLNDNTEGRWKDAWCKEYDKSNKWLK